ncbi:hypothetical protein LEMLEM_LOCUS16146 [Lemmus lemmus]
MCGAWVGRWTVAVQLESHCRVDLLGSRCAARESLQSRSPGEQVCS